MPQVLLYNITGKKAAGIKLLCGQMGISHRTVAPEDFGRPIGALLGLSADDRVQEDAAFTDEMLYLVDMGGMLSIFLGMLKKRKLTVPLKAVMTESNLTSTSCELCRELNAERKAIQKGMTAHQESQEQQETPNPSGT